MNRLGWLAFGVVLVGLALGGAAPRHARGRGLEVAVERIGRASIKTKTPSEPLQEGELRYYVDQRETVAISLSAPLPRGARLYPLVRREGSSAWQVRQPAAGLGGRNVAGIWLAEVRFGEPSDLGTRFALMAIVSAEPLPPTAIPEGLRRQSTLAESAVVQVERRRGRPFVAISDIGSVPVYSDKEIEVHDMATVRVVARDIPPQARVGIIVHPTTTDHRWVMPGLSGNGSGEITTFFGTGEPGDDFFRYTVSAFVAWRDEIPPYDVEGGIPASSWDGYQARFLAQSRIVRVIRWEGELRIKAIGSLFVVPNRILLVGPQEDIHGAVHRKLRAGERVWLVCLPPRGQPWIAGWTSRLRPSGQWVVNAAELERTGTPSRFDLVAVLATDAPPTQTQGSGNALREWLHRQERPQHSVRIQVQP